MRLLINQYRNTAFNLEKIDSLYRDGLFIDVLYSGKDEVLASYSSRENAEKAFRRILTEIASGAAIIIAPAEKAD